MTAPLDEMVSGMVADLDIYFWAVLRAPLIPQSAILCGLGDPGIPSNPSGRRFS